jgi:hypothetical protein
MNNDLYLFKNAEAINLIAERNKSEDDYYDLSEIVSKYTYIISENKLATDNQLSDYLFHLIKDESFSAKMSDINKIISNTRVRIVKVGDTYEIISVLEFIKTSNPFPGQSSSEED